MHRDNAGRSRSRQGLVRLDLAAHGAALASCAAGAIIVESVTLVAATSHHAATILFRLLFIERRTEQARPGIEVAYSVVQIVLCLCCLVLGLIVIAMGTHRIVHASSLDVMAMAGFALPGALASATTIGLAYGPVEAGDSDDKADALLSAAPIALVLGVAFCDLGVNAGRLDAVAGLAAVLVLCVRTVINLRETRD